MWYKNICGLSWILTLTSCNLSANKRLKPGTYWYSLVIWTGTICRLHTLKLIISWNSQRVALSSALECGWRINKSHVVIRMLMHRLCLWHFVYPLKWLWEIPNNRCSLQPYSYELAVSSPTPVCDWHCCLSSICVGSGSKLVPVLARCCGQTIHKIESMNIVDKKARAAFCVYLNASLPQVLLCEIWSLRVKRYGHRWSSKNCGMLSPCPLGWGRGWPAGYTLHPTPVLPCRIWSLQAVWEEHTRDCC